MVRASGAGARQRWKQTSSHFGRHVTYHTACVSMQAVLDFFRKWWLPTVLVLAALPRFGLASFEHGVNHPDEIFQMLEPAHRWVYGYGIQSWEFQEGARSWLLPGVLALLWKALALLGLSDPLVVVPLLRVPFVAAAVYAVYLASRLAARLSGDGASLLACLFAAFMPLALILDFRTTTEAASAPIVLLAVLAIIDGRLVRAGAWAALLVFLRPSNGVVALCVVGVLVFEGRLRDLARFALGASPVAVAGGALDWATWGSPFHHLAAYARFNWTESGASIFGTQSPWTYGLVLLVAALPLALCLPPAALGLLRKIPEGRTPLAIALLYLAAHSAFAHKEPRFLLPIMPLLGALTASGLVALLAPWFTRRVAAPHVRASILAFAAAAMILYGTLRAASLTYEDLGDVRGEARDHILFGKRDSVNRLLVQAGNQPDLCGVLILGLMPNELFSGGKTYLHRDVLLTSPKTRELWLLMSNAANYAVAPDVPGPPGWHRVAERGGVTLLKRPGECAALPDAYHPRYTRPQSIRTN